MEDKLTMELLMVALGMDQSATEEDLQYIENVEEEIEELEDEERFDLADALINLLKLKEKIDEPIVVTPSGGLLVCSHDINRSLFRFYYYDAGSPFFMNYIWTDMVDLNE